MSSPPTAGSSRPARRRTPTCSGAARRQRQLRRRDLLRVRLHPLGPIVLAGMVMHPIDGRARGRRGGATSGAAPEELCTAPHLAGSAGALRPARSCRARRCSGCSPSTSATPTRARRSCARSSRTSARRRSTWSSRCPTRRSRRSSTRSRPKGWLNYHRGVHLTALPDDAIDAYVEHGARVASPMSQAIVFRHGGAVSRVPDDATPPAIATRPTCGTRSRRGATRPTRSATSRGCASLAAMAPFATGGVYLNFEQDEGEAARARRLQRREVRPAGGAQGQVRPGRTCSGSTRTSPLRGNRRSHRSTPAGHAATGRDRR